MFLNSEGKVIEASIVESTDRDFGYALQAALLNAQFQPASISGFRIRRTESFRLNADAKAFPSSTSVSRAADRRTTLISSDELDTPLTSHYKKLPRVAGGQEGYAEIEFIVNQSGLVCEPRILHASSPECGYAGVHAVHYWIYSKPTKAGSPVNSTQRVRFDFNAGNVSHRALDMR